MKRTKGNKGITLVALIITIVVLLILATVAIGTVRNSSIIGHAQNAANLFGDKQKEEEEKLKEYEEKLKELTVGKEGSFYEATTIDGCWVIKTPERIGKVLLNTGAIENFDYKVYTVEEVLNTMEESERESAREAANKVIENYGEINQVIVATQLDTEWGENFQLIVVGVKPFVYGLMVDNNNKLLLLDPQSDELKIEEELTLNNNPSEDIKNRIYKESGTYEVYAVEGIAIGTLFNNADCAVVIDWENNMMGVHLYIEECKASEGIYTTISIQQNDTEINVSLNGEDKIIDSTFYKVTDSSGNIFYLDNNKEKIYKEDVGIEVGKVEEGKPIVVIEKNNYPIEKVGYITQ